eukprot:g6619.t1
MPGTSSHKGGAGARDVALASGAIAMPAAAAAAAPAAAHTATVAAAGAGLGTGADARARAGAPPHTSEAAAIARHVVFADAATFSPSPVVVTPPGAPGCPTARPVGAESVLLIWQQPLHGGGGGVGGGNGGDSGGGDSDGDGGHVLTFNTIRVRPVVPGPGDDARRQERELEIEVPATHGEARYEVDGLATGYSYTFQVKARNIEDYGPWSPASDIAAPLDPYRFRIPVEVRLGCAGSNYCLGEIVVGADSSLADARGFIRTKLRALGDGYREAPCISSSAASGVGDTAAAPRQQRVLSLLQARLPHPDRFFFVRDGGGGTVVARNTEARVRVVEVADGAGAALLGGGGGDDGEGEGGGADARAYQLYLQYEQHAQVVQTELHEYRPKYLIENVVFEDRANADGASAEAKRARRAHFRRRSVGPDTSKARVTRRPSKGLEHQWDQRHKVVM